jgi:hypothetical protein
MQQFIHEQHGETMADNDWVCAGVGLLVLIGIASLGSHILDWFAPAVASVLSLFGG